MSIIFATPIFKPLSVEEKISWTQALQTLQSRTITVFHPQNFKPEQHLPRVISNNTINFLALSPKCFKSTDTYNRLMLNPSFYEQLGEFEYVCILQLDVFLLHDDFDFWINQPFNYIGAPWFEGWGNQRSTVITGAGNGGFSLRHITNTIRLLRTRKMKKTLAQSVLAILKRPYSWTTWLTHTIYNSTHHSRVPKLNEDRWLAHDAPQYMPWYQVAPPEIAMKFSFDAQPSYLYELNNRELPTGIHAWWKYDPDFMKPIVHSFGHQWEPKSTS